MSGTGLGGGGHFKFKIGACVVVNQGSYKENFILHVSALAVLAGKTQIFCLISVSWGRQ